jgi:hypothetical protein
VPLVFTIRNTGRSSLTLQLNGREPTADFQVTTRRGEAVWSKLRGKTLMSVLRLYPLDPGKSLVFRHTWNQRGDSGKPVAPGEYLVRAVLLTDTPEGLGSEQLTISII